MGSMRERRPGVWELRVYAGQVDGKKRWVSRTHHGGKRTAAKALAMLEAGVQAPPSDCTVGRLLDMYVASRTANWSPTTRRDAIATIERWIRPTLGDRQASTLRVRDIERALDEIAERSSAWVARKVRSILRATFEDGIRWEVVPTNPARSARSPMPTRQARAVTPLGKVRDLIADAPTVMGMLIRLAVVTGCRRGELLALRWEDVKGSTLVVARSVVGAQGELTVKTTKTGRPKVVALDPETVRMVEAWRAESEAQAEALEVGLSELIFPQRPGESLPWWPDTLSSKWRTLADRHGLEGVRFHDLRHTMVSTLIAAGFDPRTVADRAGHSSPTMTLDGYSHAAPARDVEAADLLGRLLDG